MQVSHETIYPSLFIQTRGVLKKELMVHLRTARQMRQAAGADAEAVASIMIVAWQLFPRRLVPRIGSTRPANPAHGGQALLKR
jgi:hypothetical protein